MSVISYSLGAAQEVTGSKHILEIDGRSFMIDCGAFQGKRQEADKKNRDFDFAADKIEGVVLTHAHFDHCGLLPVLTKNGFGGSIFATPANMLPPNPFYDGQRKDPGTRRRIPCKAGKEKR